MSMITFPRILSVEWLREMYQTEELTPVMVIQEIIRRAEEDEDMSIWITPPSMERIQPYLDGLETINPADAPLWGIPFAIKDNIDLKGIPTTAGCAEYAYTPAEHATVVERLITAGAIPVGKTNLDQFATGLVGTRSPYGETKNALRKDLISGGSSSGSAVSVAVGQAAFALGTDTAGSGRVPASLNNLVGFKSSVGAWPKKGVVPACESIDCVTVFADSMETALEVDEAVRGVDEKDPWSKAYAKPGKELPGKIILPKEPIDFFGPFAEEYRKAWEKTLKQLEQLPIPITYVDYELFAATAQILYGGPWVAERWEALGDFITQHPGASFPVTEQILRSGSADEYDAAALFKAIHTLQQYKLEAWKLLENAVLITPTNAGTWTREQVRINPIGTNSDMGRFTNHCNLLDLCAIAIPSFEAGENLPFGITIFATADKESLVCGMADLLVNEGKQTEAASKDTTLVAVCGLHMRGFALEKQMKELGAKFIREDQTAAKYQFIKLPTNPAKPGLIKQKTGGGSINIELWEMPSVGFGTFVTSIPSPLGIGKIELQDGSEVPGFICEDYAKQGAEDITHLKSWRNLSEGEEAVEMETVLASG
ncbi:allophanate hydrolase [Gracilibacillus oryzae]|uniref:Allophanate hydrolase n=1 Tax=Gracilibacillus oryzae TaxID=1672701 RepID=A0A7C8KUJ5_9BACI|nr:allophanate hydrolase [Gracilibacillus oryzae]KAB8133094.1 allophanate hydrolase [Gracilibacillus oryzae]